MTFASRIDRVYPSGDPANAPTSARNLVETFIVTDGVASEKLVQRRVDKRRATIVDLWPSGNIRIPLFRAGGQVYFLDPTGPTRVIVIDGPDGPLIVALEASDGSTLSTTCGRPPSRSSTASGSVERGGQPASPRVLTRNARRSARISGSRMSCPES